MVRCRPIAARMSSGQSTMGGNNRAAGSAILMIPTSSRRLRSTKALVKWVVPIITVSIADLSTALSASTWARAAVMPEPTSSVVVVLHNVNKVSPSITTASVLVPPTSIPMRMLLSPRPALAARRCRRRRRRRGS